MGIQPPVNAQSGKRSYTVFRPRSSSRVTRYPLGLLSAKSFFDASTADKISEEQKKWLLTLRRDMNAQRKREVLLQEILVKDSHSDLEILAIELSHNDDRDSFFNLQKVLDLILSKKNEKQAFGTKKKALERKIYEQEKKKEQFSFFRWIKNLIG